MSRQLYGFLISLLLICSGCQHSQETSQKQSDETTYIYDLNDSTEIIMQLIKENDVATILADQDPQAIDTLLKNFSPSEMAIEAEALQYNGISALIFYKNSGDWKVLEKALSEIAHQHPSIKFVKIDADKLFKVTQNAQIETFPAILFLKNRKEIERIEPLDMVSTKRIPSILKMSSPNRRQLKE